MTWRFVVEGRVQGVGFRWFVLRHARDLGIGGFVRSLPDGSVEVVAAGPPPAIDRLARHLADGPTAARVTRVTRTEAADHPLTTNFEVR
jgi:acylphosphatase